MMLNKTQDQPMTGRAGLIRATSLLVMPRDGTEAVAALLATARHCLDLKAFKLDSERLLEVLASAVCRGVVVRVLLNSACRDGQRLNDAAFERLRRDGAQVRWTSPAFMVAHEKSAVIDGARALIATFNFTERNLSCSRDFGVVIDDAALVAGVGAGFEADWDRTAFVPSPGGPLVFDRTGRAAMVRLIDGARHSLRVQHPKFCDMAVVDAILSAAARGVRVRILCGGGGGLCDRDRSDTDGALRMFNRAGIDVRRQRRPKLHAKLILADRDLALVGSMNIHRDSFDCRRELGVLIGDPAVLNELRRHFRLDWAGASARCGKARREISDRLGQPWLAAPGTPLLFRPGTQARPTGSVVPAALLAELLA